jgi:hypothetical protein
MESFLSTLRVECVYRNRFDTHQSAQREIFYCIEAIYLPQLIQQPNFRSHSCAKLDSGPNQYKLAGRCRFAFNLYGIEQFQNSPLYLVTGRSKTLNRQTVRIVNKPVLE